MENRFSYAIWIHIFDIAVAGWYGWEEWVENGYRPLGCQLAC
jgi:hypothetical protein